MGYQDKGYVIVENFLSESEHQHYLEVSQRVYRDSYQGDSEHYSWNDTDNLNKVEGACNFEPEFLRLASHPKLVETARQLLSTEESSEEDAKDSEAKADSLKTLFQKALSKTSLDVVLKSLKSNSVSAIISEDEHSKRFKSMQHMMGTGANTNDLFNQHKLILNKNNKVVQRIIELEESKKDTDLKENLCQHVYDLAKLSHDSLSADEMQAFIKRSNDLLEKSIKS